MSQQLCIKESQVADFCSNQNSHEGGEETQPLESEVIRRLQQINLRVEGVEDDEDYLVLTDHNLWEGTLLFLQNLIMFFLLPIYLCAAFITIQPNEAVVFNSFGKIRRIIREPGCHYNPLLNPQRVSMKMETLSVKGSTVPDLKGSPMNVSAIVNYKIKDPLRALYACSNYQQYLYNQSSEVLRTVCSRFAYRSPNEEPCLMNDSQLIGHHMAGLLQSRVEVCGIQIEKMEIMEVAYHAEIAQSLLLVQQAQAKVDARKLIVDGCVEIVNGALENLQEKGIELTEENQHDLAKRLMIITCSDQGSASPVITV